jgi:tRNA1(Val) A37 N6-methylase TrmN6
LRRSRQNVITAPLKPLSQTTTQSFPRIDDAPERQFTYRYAQPDAYHFCQDSVLFPLFVANRVRPRSDSALSALDLCAGCGVIGFELAHHLPAVATCDFVEIQDVFRSYFESNLEITKRSASDFRFLQTNYETLLTPEYAGRYDLIVTNPPYFFPNEGKLSPSEVKNRCRFFLDSDLQTLLRVVLHALKSQGEAYLLAKPGAKHGRDSIAEISTYVATLGATCEIVADIRGTYALLLTKQTSPNSFQR